ncbi:MAG: hypothetical protein ABIQ32_10145 [Sphingomicrobium sp.]
MEPEHEREFEKGLLSPIGELEFVRLLLADLHDDLDGKIGRFRQLTDLSGALGSAGTMLPGAYTTSAAWREARISFVQGNYVATVMLCQGLAEHVLAAHLEMLGGDGLPPKITFPETLRRCQDHSVIAQHDADDMRRLMALRNPLSHFRAIDDPATLMQRVLQTRESPDSHLLRDATFAISMAIRLLALPAFRLEGAE